MSRSRMHRRPPLLYIHIPTSGCLASRPAFPLNSVIYLLCQGDKSPEADGKKYQSRAGKFSPVAEYYWSNAWKSVSLYINGIDWWDMFRSLARSREDSWKINRSRQFFGRSRDWLTSLADLVGCIYCGEKHFSRGIFSFQYSLECTL